ncbi:uncharacterized protein [Temnothorax nylanderi]|uniref:uncharacterized protein n=1 Tax=Temnothorax nylanderi TaxID=102681 RepID=UPI003A875C2F
MEQKEAGIESEQQGDKGKRREGEGERKARGRPTKAEELGKQRGRTDSLGSVLDYIQKRKREELEEEAKARAEEEILERFSETKRIFRSPPAKVKKGVEAKEGMAAEEMFKEVLRKLEDQEKERKKDNEEIKFEIKGLKEEWKRSEEIWKKQREALEERVRKLEEKMEERIKRLEVKIGERKKEKKGEAGNENEEVVERMREIERKLEKKEREERRRNVVIRGLEVKEGGRRQEAEKLLEGINVKVKVIEVKKIGGDIEKGREMVLLKLENEEQKWEIMEKKKNLAGRKERIMEDLSWEERRMNWRLREIARREEEREGGRGSKRAE